MSIVSIWISSMNIDIIPRGMQLKLSLDVGQPQRPKISDVVSQERYVDALIPRVLGWLRECGEFVDDTPGEYYLQQLREELLDSVDYYNDGYEIAKNLERRHYWSVDASLVELLDDSRALRVVTFNSLIKEWVFSNGILPQYSVGQSVRFVTMRNIEHVGEITRINVDQAQYVIYCAELGHVRPPKMGSSGIYIDYECVIDEAR